MYPLFKCDVAAITCELEILTINNILSSTYDGWNLLKSNVNNFNCNDGMAFILMCTGNNLRAGSTIYNICMLFKVSKSFNLNLNKSFSCWIVPWIKHQPKLINIFDSSLLGFSVQDLIAVCTIFIPFYFITQAIGLYLTNEMQIKGYCTKSIGLIVIRMCANFRPM